MRLAMLSLFAQGMGLGFLGILVSREALYAQNAGFGVATAVCGTLLGTLPGPQFFHRRSTGPATRAFLASCGIVSAAGLVALASIRSREWEAAPLLLLGLAAGANLRLSAALVLPMLPARSASSLLSLAGASFGLGGLAACLAVTNEFRVLGMASFPLWAAVAPAMMAFAAVRSVWLNPRYSGAARARTYARSGTSPRSILLVASLVMQASACGIAACWLVAYLSRTAGFSGTAGAVILGVMWLALSVGWAVSRRLPGVRDNLLALGIPVVAVAAGAILLLWQVFPLAAAPGAALLGIGMGMLVPLTLGLARWPLAFERCRWIRRSLHLTLPTALVTGWAVGALSYAIATDALIWGMLACFAGALAAIVALVGDYRVSGESVLI